MKNNFNIEGLEKKILDLFIEYDTEELQLPELNDVISPYEILMLICFVGDMKSIKIENAEEPGTYQFRYNNETYKIPKIKILKKGEKLYG